jgi:hypothetical protein
VNDQECSKYAWYSPPCTRGPFYSPKAARSRWEQSRKAIFAFCRVAHRTGTVQCPVQIAFLNWRSRPLKIWSRWRTGQSGAPIRSLARPRVTRGLRGRPLARPTVGSPDSPMNFSRTPLTNSREQPVDQTSTWHTGHCPVHHRTVRCTQAALSLGCFSQVLFFFCFPWFYNLDKYVSTQKQCTKSRTIPSWYFALHPPFCT